MNPTPSLLIDDNPEYCLLVKEPPKEYRFDILVHHNIQEGIAALEWSRRIKEVILNGRCLLEPGQKSPARTNFLFHAQQQISNIEIRKINGYGLYHKTQKTNTRILRQPGKSDHTHTRSDAPECFAFQFVCLS